MRPNCTTAMRPGSSATAPSTQRIQFRTGASWGVAPGAREVGSGVGMESAGVTGRGADTGAADSFRPRSRTQGVKRSSARPGSEPDGEWNPTSWEGNDMDHSRRRV
ncbi:hypothetical protein MVI01_67110 [Myxococcus virescens]|uniref:Uncharacterized protein n=1 Tax=Myxococcus virescens TaxID=83456 RepID=A0A511HMX7_9BACT|nr:hypothetical protein MVI01_67110 [Myxococcus virescens]